MNLRGKLITLIAGDTKGTFIICNHCGSVTIGHSALKKKFLDDGTLRVSYKVFCNNCNATAIVEEKWKINQ